jgi:hypothetical protein
MADEATAQAVAASIRDEAMAQGHALACRAVSQPA